MSKSDVDWLNTQSRVVMQRKAIEAKMIPTLNETRKRNSDALISQEFQNRKEQAKSVQSSVDVLAARGSPKFTPINKTPQKIVRKSQDKWWDIIGSEEGEEEQQKISDKYSENSQELSVINPNYNMVTQNRQTKSPRKKSNWFELFDDSDSNREISQNNGIHEPENVIYTQKYQTNNTRIPKWVEIARSNAKNTIIYTQNELNVNVKIPENQERTTRIVPPIIQFKPEVKSEVLAEGEFKAKEIDSVSDEHGKSIEEQKLKFRELCKDGKLEEVKKFHALIDKVHWDTLNGFVDACANGHLEVAQWLNDQNLQQKYLLTNRELIESLSGSLQNGHLEVAKWLMKYEFEGLDDFNNERQLIFESIIMSGNSELSIALFYEKYIVIKEDLNLKEKNIYIAIRSGYLHILIWVVKIYYPGDNFSNFFKEITNIFFNVACQHGHVKIAKWIRKGLKKVKNANIESNSKVNNDDLKISSETFLEICHNGNLDILKWLNSKYSKLEFINFYIENKETDSNSENSSDTKDKEEIYSSAEARLFNLKIDAINRASSNGKLEMVKWMCQTFNFTKAMIKSDNYAIFRFSCEYGDLLHAQWLANRFNLSGNDLIDFDLISFENIVKNNHFHILEWLFDEFGAELNNNHFKKPIFMSICMVGNLKALKWLTEKYFFNLQMFKEFNISPFDLLCQKGHLDCVKWFKKEFNVKKNYLLQTKNSAFKLACSNGHLDVAQWLTEEFRFTKSEVILGNNSALHEARKNGHENVVQWLVDEFGFKNNARNNVI